MQVRDTLRALGPQGDNRIFVAATMTTVMAAALTSAGVDTAASTPGLDPERIEIPATVAAPGSVARVARAGAGPKIISAASTNGIPARALEAYQRAAAVIGAVDERCGLSWNLLAAIGRVESDHGRFAGSVLGSDGVSRPGIVGPALDGGPGVARVVDTDAGQYDGDAEHDRAVGPLQFIPSTWSAVGVDADSDGRRDPQDLDDAALAAGVYLCSGADDLASPDGANAALTRYNHSHAYVDLVRSIADAYGSGDYVSVATRAYGPVSFELSGPGARLTKGTTGKASGSGSGSTPASKPKPQRSPSPTTSGAATPAPQPKADQGTKQPAKGSLAQVIAAAPAAATAAVDQLQQAMVTCQAQLTAAQTDALGGVSACAQAVLAGGAGALDSLLSTLGIGALDGLLKP